MAWVIVLWFISLLFSAVIHDGLCSVVNTTGPEDRILPCECRQSMSDLEKRVKELEERLTAGFNEMKSLVSLRNSFISFERRNALEHKEIRALISKLSKEQNSGTNRPSSEPLIVELGGTDAVVTSAMADEARKMENLTTLIKEVNDKFKEVESLTSEVTELQQENKVLREEIETEKRVRRHLQVELNETQSLVVEIKEMVNERESKNSTLDEVAEIVFARIAEFDVLNKTAIENQLKRLEYSVKDVFKNETQLIHRLDSVENACVYTAGLLENGTLVDRENSIASTMRIFEKNQLEQGSAVGHLELQVEQMNVSLVQKVEELQHALSAVDSSTNETMLAFSNKLSKMNDTWNNKSTEIDITFSVIDEKINETDFKIGNVVNVISDTEITFRALFSEAQGSVLNMKNDMEKMEVRLEELTQLSVELEDVQNNLNRAAQKDELRELSQIVTEQNRQLEENTSATLVNLYGIVNNTADRIDDVERNFNAENKLIRQDLNDLMSQGKQAQERANELITELRVLGENLSRTFDFFDSRVENLSLRMDGWIEQQNVSVNSVARDIRELRDLQLETTNTTFKRCEDMEALLQRNSRAHNEEMARLTHRLETAIAPTTNGEENLSGLRIKEEETPDDGTEEGASCPYVLPTTHGELVVAYRYEGTYEELSKEISIPHGEQLRFSCRKIGRFVLFGSDELTCINGRWSDNFPRCQKLLEESVIKGKLFSSSDIVPPIDFAPLEVDVVDSRLASSVTGELVVYPGITLNLICLYPRLAREPRWEIEEKAPHPHIAAWDPSSGGTGDLKAAYKLRLTIAAATKDNSGNFTCISPHGKRHTIRLLVKDIKCPDFVVDPTNHLSITYTQHSGAARKRIMTTEAVFHCSCGYSLNGSTSAVCKASGTWSQNLPTCLKEETKGCIKPDLTKKPGLYASPEKCVYSTGDKVTFKCSNGRTPVGHTTARCQDDGVWTVSNGLPSCD